MILFLIVSIRAASAEVVQAVEFGPAATSSGQFVKSYDTAASIPLCCAAAPKGERMAVGLGNGNAVVIAIRKQKDQQGQFFSSMIGHEAPLLAVSFSPDGHRLLTGSQDNTARIWTTRSGKVRRILRGHAGAIRAVAYSPDGKKALTGSDDSTARIWDAEKGKCIQQLTGHTGPIRAAVFLRNGRRVLTGSDDQTIRLWDTTDGRLIRTIPMDGKVLAVAVSPDGRHAAVSLNRDEVEIWDLQTGRRVRVLWGHAGIVCSAAFSSDGKNLMTGSRDGSIIFWDMATGQEIYRSVQGGPVGQVAYVPGSPYVIALNEKTSVAVIDPRGKMPPPIRSRREKWAFVWAALAAGLMVPAGLVVVLGVARRRHPRGMPPRVGMPMPPRNQIKFQALIAVMTILIALPFLEAGLRLILNISYKGHLDGAVAASPADSSREVEDREIVFRDSNPKIGYRFLPNIKTRYRGAAVSTNNMGYRDDPVPARKPSRTLRVLGYGDSSMFGFGVNKEDTYMDLLEAEFNELLRPDWKVEFINTAVPGYNTTQEAESFLKYGLKLDPDVVMVQFDENDLQTILINPKPDFLFVRKLMLVNLPLIMQGHCSDLRAFHFLGQMDQLSNPAYPHTGWTAVETAFRDMAKECRARSIPLFGIQVFENIGMLSPEGGDSVHDRVLDLWNRIGIEPIRALPLASRYLENDAGDWLKIVLGAEDFGHPNRIGHALIAQAILPRMHDTLLNAAGIGPEQSSTKASRGNIILRDLSRHGMHNTEKWGGERVNWTGLEAHFHFVPAGGKVIVPMSIGHPDVSPSNPVKVTLRVDGVMTGSHPESREISFEATRRGPISQAIDVHDLVGNPLELTVTVNRTFTTPTDRRGLGVAIHNLRFE